MRRSIETDQLLVLHAKSQLVKNKYLTQWLNHTGEVATNIFSTHYSALGQRLNKLLATKQTMFHVWVSIQSAEYTGKKTFNCRPKVLDKVQRVSYAHRDPDNLFWIELNWNQKDDSHCKSWTEQRWWCSLPAGRHWWSRRRWGRRLFYFLFHDFQFSRLKYQESQMTVTNKDSMEVFHISFSHCLSVVELRPSSSLSTSFVVPLRGDWAIFCHAGSGGFIGREWSDREKSFEIFRHRRKLNPRHGVDRQWDTFILALSYHDPDRREDRQWDIFILPLSYHGSSVAKNKNIPVAFGSHCEHELLTCSDCCSRICLRQNWSSRHVKGRLPLAIDCAWVDSCERASCFQNGLWETTYPVLRHLRNYVLRTLETRYPVPSKPCCLYTELETMYPVPTKTMHFHQKFDKLFKN